MIRYEEIEPHLIDFLQGNVAEEVEYRVKAYLQQNPDFQQELDELEETLEFTQSTPLVQPAPELKMNFYAMLNEYKAQQAQARPSLREKLKHFLQVQFQWQSLSVGILTVLVLIMGYWGVSVFQEKFRQTQVAMSELEFEKENKQNAYIEIPKPTRKESKAPQKEEENAVEGRETVDILAQRTLPETTPVIKDTKALSDYVHKEADELGEKAIVLQPTQDTYNFTNAVENGLVEIKNPNGNINLRSYAGEGVKVESVPAQSFVGKVDNNRVSIESNQSPQIDMNVLLPQNRFLQLEVVAKQNITFDMQGVQLVSNNKLTSQEGNVEVTADASNAVSIFADAKEVENDFETSPTIKKSDAMALGEAKESRQAKSAVTNEKKDISKAKKKLNKEREENKARSKNAEIAVMEDAEVKAKDVATSNRVANSPNFNSQGAVTPTQGTNRTLQVSSPRGKAKIKKR
jgi:hypothetical protein